MQFKNLGVYLNEKEAKDLVFTSLDKGINFFDTGPLYGNGLSEKYIGRILKNNRDDVIISSKVGLEKDIRPDGSFGVKIARLSPRYIRKSLEKSLLNLKTDYIDLFKIHAFDNTTPLSDTLGEIQNLIKEGLIKSFGICNFNPQQLLKTIKETNNFSSLNLAALQFHYNIIERMMERKIIPICFKNNISIIPYRALARGILNNKYSVKKELPEFSRASESWRVRKWLKPNTLNLVNKIDKLALSHNITVGQLSLLWLMKNVNTCSVLVGARNKKQLLENLLAIDTALPEGVYDDLEDIINNSGEIKKIHNRPNVYMEK